MIKILINVAFRIVKMKVQLASYYYSKLLQLSALTLADNFNFHEIEALILTSSTS